MIGTTTTRAALGVFAAAGALLLGGGAYGPSAGVGDATVSASLSANGVRLPAGRGRSGLYPGGARVLTVRLKRAGAYAARHARLSASVKAVENGARSEAEAEAGAKCWPGWFEVAEFPGKGASHVSAGALARALSDRRIRVRMKEVDGNQDGCEGERVTVAYRER